MHPKAGTGISKSDEIRRYLADNPAATPKQITAALREQGISVSDSLASAIRYGKRRRAAARRANPPGPAGSNGTPGRPLTVDDLLAVKKLADRLGGIDRLHHALDALRQLA